MEAAGTKVCPPFLFCFVLTRPAANGGYDPPYCLFDTTRGPCKWGGYDPPHPFFAATRRVRPCRFFDATWGGVTSLPILNRWVQTRAHQFQLECGWVSSLRHKRLGMGREVMYLFRCGRIIFLMFNSCFLYTMRLCLILYFMYLNNLNAEISLIFLHLLKFLKSL
jgi:hypothetical protein